MIITIDGPIATGKSTIAKQLAEEIGYIYFDTGAMYRSVTYAIIKQGVNFESPEELERFLDNYKFDIKIHRGERRYYVDDEDVTDFIRGGEVTKQVSKVSAKPLVREHLMKLQKDWSLGVNVIFEGRDMGTVVFPEAEIKVFLTGRVEVRAKRRYEELKAKFPDQMEDVTLEQMLEQINQRDTYDTNREIAPLKQADDAFVVDTSDLTVDEIVEKILDYKVSKKTKYNTQS